MNKKILSLAVAAIVSLGMQAQDVMDVKLKNGKTVTYDMSNVKKVSWREVEVSKYKFVDLDLPSKTLWATTNIGAEKPEDYGLYFQWGDAQGYEKNGQSFTWSTYKWCKASDTFLTKYNSKSSYGYVDNRTVLELEDDAAFVNWGEEWRMPSDDQLQELVNVDFTTSEWTTENGVKGLKITSLKNGNSIFLPAGGYCEDAIAHYDAY